MPNAISHNEKLAFVAETAWGTTPASAGKEVRYTSIDSKQEKQTIESGELTTSREVADIIQTARSGGLDVGFELSYDSLDPFLEGLLGSAWQVGVPAAGSDTLRVGAARKSFTVERQFTDLTPSPGRFMSYKGAIVQKIDLNVAVGQIITGSMSFMSKSPVSAGASAFTGANVAASNNVVMDPISSIQLLQEGGANVAGPTEVSMSLNSGIVSFEQLASVDPADLQAGQFTASGKLAAYFADAVYLDKFLSHATTSLKVTLGGTANKKYEFTFPKIKLTSFGNPNQGPNNKIIQTFEWKAFRDATDTTLKIVRTA